MVGRRGRAVDDDERIAPELVEQPRRRIDGQRRAADDEQVGARNRIDGRAQDRLVQRLAVKHDVGLDESAAAGTARHVLAVPNLLGRSGKPALQAVGCGKSSRAARTRAGCPLSGAARRCSA